MTKRELYHQKRERLINAVEFKPTDRLPVKCGNATIAAIERITGRSDYLAHPKEVFALAMNAWDVDIILQFVLPDRQDKQCGPTAAINICDGLRSNLAGEWCRTHGAFKSPEDVRDFCQTVPAVSEARRYVDPDITYLRWLELDGWGAFLKPAVFIPGHLCQGVPWMWYTVMGYENYLMAHALYPEALERLFAFIGEESRLRNEAIAKAIRDYDLVPIIYSGEDICGNDGPMVSPQILHDIYFPHQKRAIAPIIEAGIHWLWHSDGNILPILPDLIDCGIGGFQGFEEDKGMDMDALAATPCRNGKLPFLFGSVNVTTTMYTTPEKIRSDIRRMVDLSKQRGGGVVLSPSSSIMANTPLENVLAFYKYAHSQS
ncbi:MAG: hypothetical protein KJ964_07965 [Verrucomicrobia bacterium]|nr:hypothetical protein [Verrucomicrobiota bacterium]MBU1735001.1 hypothetical protein [Verrucomicrobiota bacterium]MBU1856274.1 hypothetical protein [Verrucomicrobiota bacterium]